jgi:hypothetical protein
VCACICECVRVYQSLCLCVSVCVYVLACVRAYVSVCLYISHCVCGCAIQYIKPSVTSIENDPPPS